MQFIDEFRDPNAVKLLLNKINALVKQTQFTQDSPLNIMEVCGGHTHAIFKFGLDRLLPPEINFIHGPGCPVCVLPMGRIDTCIDIAKLPDVIFCTFGDAMRVPGQQGSLLATRGQGYDIRIIYSPLDALTLAKRNPQKQIVLFGLGFETTMPGIALTIQQAKQQQLTNFSLLCQHISIIPTLKALLTLPNIKIDAFLGPGHLSMIIGVKPYQFISENYAKPVVISGFEPVDMLQSVVMILMQLIRQQYLVENQYRRIVADQGNLLAQAVIKQVFTLQGNDEWRGLGEILGSGVRLSKEYQEFDAELRFNTKHYSHQDDPNARCGDVLTGRSKPINCPLFGKKCTPQSAYGALMVSSEGACAAYYQYRQGDLIC
ncbi:hydrogenase formation protein HypD [Orbus sturtevantii]|uniref:hydrogenase formation protein HypD n=1 Tax=Orbus sturtevantii TaxID=3074109 RepID=UPI00370DCB44